MKKRLKKLRTNLLFEQFVALRLEYNTYNGFIFDILAINDTSLFGINISLKLSEPGIR